MSFSRAEVHPGWGEAEAAAGRFPVIVALDLEATGLSSAVEHVIEIGAVKFRGHEVIDRYHTLVNPGMRISPIVRRLTGIDDRQLASAPPLRQVVPGLRRFMEGCDLLAHGAGYDVSFLHQVLGETAGARLVFDSIDLARVVFPSAPSYSLGGLCDLVGLQHPRPHHALEDAEATFRVFLALVRAAGALEPEVLDELRRLTSGSSHSLRTVFHDMATPGEPPALAQAVAPELPEAPRVAQKTYQPEELAALLGPAGPLAAEPGWELREQQQQMCLAVAQSLARGVNLVVEAGTGIGKSLAYLLPALAWANAAEEPVAVSTHTINLQEQLLHKDLPLAARILGVPLRAVLLKGRAHYLSTVRWQQLLAGTAADGPAARLEGMDPDELLIFKLKVTVWLSRTKTGDRDELRLFGQDERIWRSVASEWGADCRNPECVDGPSPCFYHLSRRRARSADVVVVNHALLLADALQDPGQLPVMSRLVIDEAHHLEDAATRGLTEEVREDDVLAALALASAGGARRRPTPALVALQDAVLDVCDALRTAARAAFGVELGREVGLDSELAHQPALGLATAAAARAVELVDQLAEAEAAVAGERVRRFCALLAPREGGVGWVSFGRDGRVTLRRAPLEVGPVLRDVLFAGRDSIVFTSATLSVGGSFDYFCERVGLSASRLTEMVLESPFDFLNQALLCLPEDMPAPGSAEFDDAVADTVEEVARTLQGRTLVLFTSNHQLAAVSERLAERLRPEGIEVLVQGRGAGTRRALSERFAAHPAAVLCGTASFWEGLDLPGKALACVVVVRLPFRSPTDPVLRARGQLLHDSFLQLTLPEAVLRMKQGFGRLIRRASDRGAVVILDVRVLTRGYGARFLESLPECASFAGPRAELAPAIGEWVGDRGSIDARLPLGRDQAPSPRGDRAVRAQAGRRRSQPGPPPGAG